jgi:hypothetical protein
MGGVGGETRSAAGVAAAGGSDLLRRLRDADGSEREEMGRPERVRPGEAEISERDRSANASSRFMARGGGGGGAAGGDAQALPPEEEEAGIG